MRAMESDHRRIEESLSRALKGPTLDEGCYREFREVLLRHIGIEERVLLCGLKAARIDFAQAKAIHREHAAMGALLAAVPDTSLARELERLLVGHIDLEESPEGLFALCRSGLSAQVLVVEAHAYPAVKPAPWSHARWMPRTVEAALALVDGQGPERPH
jgi:hypothetical protein